MEDPLEYQIENGKLDIPDLPGLGVLLNHKVVDPFLVREISG